jgi:F5/8 type C domain/Hypothetical glycosyl hydrolase family 15
VSRFLHALRALTACLTGMLICASVATAATADSGRVRFVKEADSAFDPYVRAPTAAQAQWMRDHYFRQKTYAPFFDSRTSWYPNAWSYRDAYALYADGRDGGIATLHPDWVLKDAQGRRLYIPWGCSGGACPQYAGDIGNPAFRRWWIDSAIRTLTNGYRGLFVDDVNLFFSVSDGTGTHVSPVDPRTGQTMTDAAWRRYMADFMEQIKAEVRAALPGIEIAHNPVWFAGHSDPDIARALLAADYIDLERGVSDNLSRGGGTYGIETFFAHVDWLHQHGKAVVYDSYATTADAAEYNLAAYFLTADDRDGFRTNYRTVPDNWWTAYDVTLGAPSGPRYVWNGLLRRDFQNGYVLVNEPGSTSQTVALPAGATGPDATPRASATLAAATGRVILTGGGTPAPTPTDPPPTDPAPAPSPSEPPPAPAPVPQDDAPPPGESKAVGRPATASSAESTSLAPGMATDGSISTRWASTWANNQWWQVDLGRSRLVSGVRLRWEDAYAAHYQVLTSLDGQTWQLAADVTLDAPIAKTTTFAVRDARYVRVLGLARATQWGISLWEGEVYGPADLVTAPSTGGGSGGGKKPHKSTAGTVSVARVVSISVKRHRSHRTVRVTGRTLAAGGRVRILLQRRAGGRWRHARRATALVRGGRFARSFRGLRRGRYRVLAVPRGGRGALPSKLPFAL